MKNSWFRKLTSWRYAIFLNVLIYSLGGCFHYFFLAMKGYEKFIVAHPELVPVYALVFFFSPFVAFKLFKPVEKFVDEFLGQSESGQNTKDFLGNYLMLHAAPIIVVVSPILSLIFLINAACSIFLYIAMLGYSLISQFYHHVIKVAFVGVEDHGQDYVDSPIESAIFGYIEFFLTI